MKAGAPVEGVRLLSCSYDRPAPQHSRCFEGRRYQPTPKAYFLDTGLASYLVGWDNPQVLQNGAMSGAVFETFVISEIIKSWANSSAITPNMSFFPWHSNHLLIKCTPR
ncbi:MAG: DUF4143 domain-containing protein [Lachnospiraceae bacterium]|nr:DUF4143 domain-containing protein [Lachnospiraceae bacterium]